MFSDAPSESGSGFVVFTGGAARSEAAPDFVRLPLSLGFGSERELTLSVSGALVVTIRGGVDAAFVAALVRALGQ